VTPPRSAKAASRTNDGSLGAPGLEDVLITAASWFGSDGLGADGLVGFMAMAARKYSEKFKVLFEWAAQRRMVVEDAAERQATKTRETREELARDLGLLEGTEDSLPHIEHMEDPLPHVVRIDESGPDEPSADEVNSLEDAIMAGAARHGSDGRGAGGLIRYFNTDSIAD
jgi:hypothetical protein